MVLVPRWPRRTTRGRRNLKCYVPLSFPWKFHSGFSSEVGFQSLEQGDSLDFFKIQGKKIGNFLQILDYFSFVNTLQVFWEDFEFVWVLFHCFENKEQ